MNGFLALVTTTIFSCVIVNAQVSMTKATSTAGSTTVANSSTKGHLSVGIAAAGGVEGPDQHGWLGFYPITHSPTTSVSDSAHHSVPVRPNPAEYHVTFPVSGHPQRTTIVNEQGEVADHLTYTLTDGEGTVDVRSLPAGTYTLQIQYAKRIQRFRFVIHR